jgi:DNA helicase-2/ATP-dependent DNA helicase PcrA
VALVADADTRVDVGGMATLMTLHNAKGLEYPIVFVIGCEEGVFPHSRAIEEGSLEEERRLCYVAITRAMRDLTMTFARRRNVFGSAMAGLPSRFLGEIPPDLVDDDRRISQPLTGARAGSWTAPAHRSGQQQAPADVAPAFRMGEDVAHPAFGDGVVTGSEPGGIVVVRFSDDGSERKLMADYAPLTRR